ncbi:MAG TPA: PAS domain S-box protein [Blastocatellia bacterium]|nr:PAS domain S-box protein [Blastocatellia bacterium]
MRTWIRRVLAPPVFDGDEDKTRMALLLNAILWVLLVRALLFGAVTWFEDAARPRPSLVLPVSILLVAMLFLMRLGYVQMASTITTIGFWIYLTVIAVINGGIRSPGFRNYIIPVLVAGLLFGRGAAIGVAGLSILAGLAMWIAERAGLLAGPVVFGPSLELLTTHAISLLIAAVLVTLATRSIMDALARARQEIAERKQAEQAVRESESRWQAIFNNAALGIAVVNANGNPVDSNPALQNMLGYSGLELRGMSFVDFTHPEDAGRDWELAREMFEGERDNYQIEKRYVTKDGQVRWGHLAVTAIRDGNGDGEAAIGVVYDITERMRAESENRLLMHALGERVKELTALHGAARILQQGGNDTETALPRLVSLLPPAFQYPEVTEARLRLGKTTAATPGFSVSNPTLRADFTVSDGQSGNVEVVYTENRPAESEGPFLAEERALINTLADMLRTAYDQQQAQLALRESEERFRAIAESIPVSILISNGPTITYANPANETLSGYARDEMARLEIWAAVHPDMREAAKERVEARQRGEAIPTRFDFKFLTKSGQVRWAYSSNTPITYQGKPSILTAVLDITERKQAEEQLLATSEQLRALTASLTSAREEEGIRIAREIHDELGSGLTSLRWDLEGFDKDLSGKVDPLHLPALREKIESMVKQTDATIGTVRRIASELRPSVLDDLGLAEAIEWQAQQFQARTGIVCSYTRPRDDFELNPEQSTAVFRIFQEALTNVLRHAEATKVDIVVKETGDDLVLTVSDDGKGITEDQILATQSLGLVGMRERAHLVGGDISISGAEGKGTVLEVRIPCPAQTSS